MSEEESREVRAAYHAMKPGELITLPRGYTIGQAAPASSGNKYHRKIFGLKAYGEHMLSVTIDVYSVETAFEVSNPGARHALKKILCAGLRGKGSRLQDLKEARDALDRAIEDEERDLELNKPDKDKSTETPVFDIHKAAENDLTVALIEWARRAGS